MKRLNLDDTWKYCMRMWRWIAERIKAGDERDVTKLKEVWLENNGINYIVNDCFFCEYDSSRNDFVHYAREGCHFCPAVKIDGIFHCTDCDYNWHKKPIKFYARLRKLNRLRKLGRKL